MRIKPLLATWAASGTLLAAFNVASADLPPGVFTDTQRVVNVNSPTLNDRGPRISADGLELFFTRTTNDDPPNLTDIFVARRQSTDEDFGPAEIVPAPVSSGSPDQMGSLSSDGLTMYFASARPGAHFTDIFHATRTSLNEPFGSAANIPGLQLDFDETSPFVSFDDLSLYYTSFDTDVSIGRIYQATRTSSDTEFGYVTSLDIIGTEHSVSSDELAIFFLTRSSFPYGSFEIHTATLDSRDDPFGTSTRLPAPINVPFESGFCCYPGLASYRVPGVF